MTWIRLVRIFLLLSAFAAMTFYTNAQKLKIRSWSTPLEIVIYPINGDNNSTVVNDYIKNLDATVFSPIDTFFQLEAQRYNLIIKHPTRTTLGANIAQEPPKAPSSDSNMLSIIRWALKFRYWALTNTPDSESNLHRVRVFVHYHEAPTGRNLEHPLGLDKGLMAIVHTFATINQDQQNNIVIAQEVLHSVDASDKHGKNGEPLFPQGYAAPNQTPIYPQTKAEIMSARIPLSINTSKMAPDLTQCILGAETAKEINWTQSPY